MTVDQFKRRKIDFVSAKRVVIELLTLFSFFLICFRSEIKQKNE
jgi:hypothetical protein